MTTEFLASARQSNPSHNHRSAILLTSYMTGSTEGRNLGTAGYSYDFVARLFTPLLARWGEVIPVPDPQQHLELVASGVRARGLEPIHVSFLPFQDTYLAQSMPNVVVPAWEFPDVPDHAFDGNPQNDWPATANRCDLVVVGGSFTQQALHRAGTTVPIHIVPVPTPDNYFQIAPWEPSQKTCIDCTAYCFPHKCSAGGAVARQASRSYSLKQAGKQLERTFRYSAKALFGAGLYRRLTSPFSAALRGARRRSQSLGRARAPARITLPYGTTQPLELSGIVYTSIFNPDDGRKNWQDLLTGFLYALADCDDATLVVKLISRRAESVEKLIRYYRNRDIPHRCRLVFLADFLSETQMFELAKASTFYLQTTKAEGNCLPLMNYLSAGRPGISPAHSAIGDYFDSQLGFVVQSHAEPAAWPHDSRLRLRTTWHRIVWPSLVEQIRASYRLAKYDPAGYTCLGDRGRKKMAQWAGGESVWLRLRAALDQVVGDDSRAVSRPSQIAEPQTVRKVA